MSWKHILLLYVVEKWSKNMDTSKIKTVLLLADDKPGGETWKATKHSVEAGVN